MEKRIFVLMIIAILFRLQNDSTSCCEKFHGMNGEKFGCIQSYIAAFNNAIKNIDIENFLSCFNKKGFYIGERLATKEEIKNSIEIKGYYYSAFFGENCSLRAALLSEKCKILYRQEDETAFTVSYIYKENGCTLKYWVLLVVFEDSMWRINQIEE